MADNAVMSAAVGVGITAALDDIGGVHYPRSKITIGADGVNDGDVSASNPMPVTGTVTANLGATDNAALDAIAASLAGTLTVGSHTVTGPLTDTELRATPVPVSGTVTATVGTITAITTLGTITNVVHVDDNAGSLTIDNAQLSVVGSGTEATALRVTIASDSTGVLSVDDNGGSLTVDGTFWQATQPVSGTVTANAGSGTFTVSGAITNTVLSVVGNGAAATAQRVTLANDSTGIIATVSTVTNLSQLGGTAIAMNTGVRSAGTQRVTIATDDVVPASQSGTWNIGTVTTLTGITNALPAGTNNIGDVDILSIAAGTNLVGDVGLQPRTSGGLTMHKTTSAATTNATNVKASAGQVYNIQCFNVNAAVRYLKLYNKASAPTVGTDTPVKTLAIPGNTAGAGFVIGWPQGLEFGTGISFALTTEATDAGTTAVALNEITVNLDYK